MRLPLLAPEHMTVEQKALYDDIKLSIGGKFAAFQTTDQETGALIGPWNAMLHEPESGWALWKWSKVEIGRVDLPRRAREIAILVVGAHFKAGYELYAHGAIAREFGMSSERLSIVSAGERPTDLDPVESAAFDAAKALVGGGVLPEACYRNVVETLGQHGANDLFFLISLYCAVAVLLNAYNASAPE